MKKSLLNKSVLAAGVLGVAVSANASMGDIKPYVGVGLDYNTYSFGSDWKQGISDANNNLKTKGFGITVPVLGIKFHDNFGVEFGYGLNKKFKITSTTDSTIPARTYKPKNMYLDLVGSMPVADQFELIGGLGMSKLSLKKGDNIPNDVSIKNKYSWRAKIGSQYNFNSNFSTRLIATFQQVNNYFYRATPEKLKFIKNMKSIGLSAIYTF